MYVSEVSAPDEFHIPTVPWGPNIRGTIVEKQMLLEISVIPYKM